MKRWNRRSVQPPKYPCTAPATTPMTDEMHGEDQAEEHRDAEAVDEPRDHVAALIVGAEPVQIAGDAIGIVDALRIFGAAPRSRVSWKAGRATAPGSGRSLLTVL